MEIELAVGDITAQHVDAIVAAANSALAGGGGVDRAIHRAAGPRLLAALRPLSPCAPGDAVVTPAFDLEPTIRFVVHAVGPRFGVDEPADQLLRGCYLAALRRCDEVSARSVAFPSISTGAFHYPLFDAARISIETLRNAVTDVQHCVLVAFDEKTRRAWARALG